MFLPLDERPRNQHTVLQPDFACLLLLKFSTAFILGAFKMDGPDYEYWINGLNVRGVKSKCGSG